MVTLPFELIQEIIEASAEGSLSHVAALATISRDFHEMYGLFTRLSEFPADCYFPYALDHVSVHPILCRTLWYYEGRPERQWPVPDEDLPQWLKINGTYVRNVIWGIKLQSLPNVFEHCPNITNLAVWVNVSMNNLKPLLPSVSTLHLTRLSINLYALFGRTDFSKDQAQISAFQTITHLSIFHEVARWEDIEGINLLPRLTHLRLADDVLEADMLHRDVIHRALRECNWLKVLIIIKGGGLADDEEWVDIKELPTSEFDFGDLDDPRVVVVQVADIVEDWKRGAMNGKDFWAFGDDVVEQRRSGLGESGALQVQT